jgi:hypothetical protein
MNVYEYEYICLKIFEYIRYTLIVTYADAGYYQDGYPQNAIILCNAWGCVLFNQNRL